MTKQRGFTLVEGLLILIVLITAITGGWYVYSSNDSVSDEMLLLRELESELLPADSAQRSELDKGCEENLSINARFDRQTCVTRIRNIFSSESVYDSVYSQLNNNSEWQSSESNEKFAQNYKGTNVCVLLTKARADFETQDVNTEITIMTLLDDNCFTSFNSVENKFNDTTENNNSSQSDLD